MTPHATTSCVAATVATSVDELAVQAAKLLYDADSEVVVLERAVLTQALREIIQHLVDHLGDRLSDHRGEHLGDHPGDHFGDQAREGAVPETLAHSAVSIRWGEQHISAETIMRFYKVAGSVLHQRFCETATDMGLAAEQQLQAIEVMWEVRDNLLECALREVRASQESHAFERRALKNEFLELIALGQGHGVGAEIAQRARTFHLPQEERYRVLIALPLTSQQQSSVQWLQEIEVHASTSVAPAVAGMVGKTMAAVIPAAVGKVLIPGQPVAAGPAVPLEQLSDSWVCAQRVAASVDMRTLKIPVLHPQLEDVQPTATRLEHKASGAKLRNRQAHNPHNHSAEVMRGAELMRGAMKTHAGWYSVETQTWRLAVPILTELRAYLLRYYWESLADDPVQRELLLKSVWQFIADASNYKKAAASLFIHENTLRYRIAKFEELTGADLSFADTRVELLWLQHVLALTPPQ